MRILLFSDLHLDRSFAWADAEAARTHRQAIRDTLENIVSLAEELRVDALASGGDLFEHDRIHPDTANFLRETFAALAPTPVLLSPGNHDWFGSQSPYETTSWSENVTIFRTNDFEPIQLADAFTVWGAAHMVPADTPNLLERWRASDRAATLSGTNVALFHGAELGLLPFLNEEGKRPHAPFTVTDLQTSGFDHAMLGHFHTPRDHDLYTYPGNPDALAFGEVDAEGCERGAVILEWNAPSSTPERTRHRVGMSRMHDIRVDLTGSPSMQQIRERIGGVLEGLTGSVRLILTGEVSRDVDLQPRTLRNLFRPLDGVQLSMSGVRIAYDLDAIERDEADTVRGRFLQLVRGADLTPEEHQRVVVVGLRALDGRTDLEVP